MIKSLNNVHISTFKSFILAGWLLAFGLVCLSQAQLTSTGGGHKAGGAAAYAGPGDILPTNWKGWWGLRCFSSTYIGNVVRIKSPSDALTSTVTCSTGGVLGVTGTAIATTCAVSCTVDILYDQSGSGSSYDLIQTSEGDRPIYLPTGFGSLPAMSFTTKYLTTGGGTADISQPWSMSNFAIRTGGGAAPIIGANDFGTSFQGTNEFAGYAGNVVIKTATDNAKHALAIVVAASSAGKIAVDGSITSSQDFGSGTFSGAGNTTLLGVNPPFDVFFTGKVSEVGNYSGAFSDANMIALSSQQLAYWGT